MKRVQIGLRGRHKITSAFGRRCIRSRGVPQPQRTDGMPAVARLAGAAHQHPRCDLHILWRPLSQPEGGQNRSISLTPNLAHERERGRDVAALLDAIQDAIGTDQVTRTVEALAEGEMGSAALMTALGLSHRPTFRKNDLDPALAGGWIERILPDSPRSPTNATGSQTRDGIGRVRSCTRQTPVLRPLHGKGPPRHRTARRRPAQGTVPRCPGS